MRIRIWNAFASNNSGSYTIVGRFQNRDDAVRLADEVQQIAKAHGKWLLNRSTDPSPLGEYAQQQGLSRHARDGTTDDWPDCGDQDWPDVWAIGNQVFVHSDYTISLPPFFGALMYARGGEVSSIVDHAHDPLVTRFQIGWDWQLPDEQRNAFAKSLQRDLFADDGPPALTSSRCAPAWDIQMSFPRISLGVVFEDLVAGTRAVQAIIDRHSGLARVDVFEALDAQDPLAFMRPCDPPDTRALQQVYVADFGEDKGAVQGIMCDIDAMGRYNDPAHPNAPLPVFPKPVFALLASRVAEALRQVGASVDVADAE